MSTTVRQLLILVLSVCLLFENSMAAVSVGQLQVLTGSESSVESPATATGTVSGHAGHGSHRNGEPTTEANAHHAHRDHTLQAPPEQPSMVQLSGVEHECTCGCDCQSDCMSNCHPIFSAAPLPWLALAPRHDRRRDFNPSPQFRNLRLLRPPISA